MLGPSQEGSSLSYEAIEATDDLPWAVADRQEPGRYRLESGHGSLAFAHGPPAFSLRRLVSPPEERLLTLRRKDERLVAEPIRTEVVPTAVIGAKGCDLRALRAQDEVFAKSAHPDPRIIARRAALFTVSVACHRPADTCFCVSRGGRRTARRRRFEADRGVGAPPRYLLEAMTERGRNILADSTESRWGRAIGRVRWLKTRPRVAP